MLELAVENSEADLENHKIDKQVLFIRCKSCGHKYMASIGEVLDDPSCRRCKR